MAIDEGVDAVIREVFGLGHFALTDETSPAEIPGWDSLGNVNVMFGLEKEFGLQFSDDDFAPATSIGELKERIRRHGIE